MKKYLIAVGLFCSLNTISFAQYGQPEVGAPEKIAGKYSPTSFSPGQAQFIGFRNPASDDLQWLPSMGKISENEAEDNELLAKIKAAKNALKFRQPAEMHQTTAAKTTTFATPTIDSNFGGVVNTGMGTPLDNTIAISNGGIIVAIVNSKIGYYTTTGTLTFSKDLYSLVNDPSLFNFMCDPKIVYDNVQDRFVFYTQICDVVPYHSFVVMGCTKTNNPTGGWYFYKLPGDPDTDSSFFDYPKMGMSTDDIYVTGNLFHVTGSGSSAHTSFNQSVIYQLKKSSFYAGLATAGDSVNYFKNITGAFTIVPASYGLSGSYGPGIFLASSEGVTTGSGNYFLFDITNKYASHAATLVTYNVAAPALYSTPGDAAQQGTSHPLNTGDSRGMDAFYLHGYVHFVHHTDVGGGYSGINYLRIKIAGATATKSTFGSTGTDKTYPAISTLTNDSTDKSVLIAYNESSSSFYPRTAVVACGNIFTWSSPAIVKAGTGYVEYDPSNPGTSDRWGDYNGMCRRYNANSPAVSWMAGMYGNSSHTWNQQIAKIYGKTDLAVSTPVVDDVNMSVFPNPVYDNCSVKFTLEGRMDIKLAIVDMQGKLVKELEGGIADEGENIFSFNKANLSDGTYLLNVYGNSNLIKSEKIIIGSK